MVQKPEVAVQHGLEVSHSSLQCVLGRRNVRCQEQNIGQESQKARARAAGHVVLKSMNAPLVELQ